MHAHFLVYPHNAYCSKRCPSCWEGSTTIVLHYYDFTEILVTHCKLWSMAFCWQHINNRGPCLMSLKKQISEMQSKPLSYCFLRLPPTTVTRWALSQWHTKGWRLAAERWCPMSSSRIRCVPLLSPHSTIALNITPATPAHTQNALFAQGSLKETKVESVFLPSSPFSDPTDNICLWVSTKSWEWGLVCVCS